MNPSFLNRLADAVCRLQPHALHADNLSNHLLRRRLLVGERLLHTASKDLHETVSRLDLDAVRAFLAEEPDHARGPVFRRSIRTTSTLPPRSTTRHPREPTA